MSVIQMPILDTVSSLEYLDEAVGNLMYETLRPELVMGVELRPWRYTSAH